MKIAKRLGFVGALLGLAAALSMGCESTETEESSIVVTVSPVDGVLIGANAAATLTASLGNSDTNNAESLVLPLKWSVANPSLGSLAKSAGLSAVYVSNGKLGANTISVHDQIGRSGVAAISQVQQSASPTNTP